MSVTGRTQYFFEQHAYRQGETAAMIGDHQNPYIQGSVCWIAWQAGYVERERVLPSPIQQPAFPGPGSSAGQTSSTHVAANAAMSRHRVLRLGVAASGEAFTGAVDKRNASCGCPPGDKS